MNTTIDLRTTPPLLDFEASSLSDCSYPISAGLCISGRIKYWIIKPNPDWIDWSLASQAIHCIKRSYIEAHGIESDIVFRELNNALHKFGKVYSDAPYWERRWLSQLGTLEIDVRDVRELISPHIHDLWEITYNAQVWLHDLTPHKADHDALAMAYTVHDLRIRGLKSD